MHSTQFYFEYISRANSVNLLQRPFKLGTIIFKGDTLTDITKSCFHGNALFLIPLRPVFNI